MTQRPVPDRGDIGPDRPVRIVQRLRGVDGDRALLVVGEEEAEVVHDHVSPLGQVVDSLDHLQVRGGAGEGNGS